MIEKEIENALEKKSIALNALIESDDSDEENFAFITHKFKKEFKRRTREKQRRRRLFKLHGMIAILQMKIV